MQANQYIYTYIYDHTESELCKLESKYLFGKEDKNKQLLSDIKVDPSCSAYIRKRVDIKLQSEIYLELIEKIKNEKIFVDDFKVEYVVLDGDKTRYNDRLDKLRDVGYKIDGNPEYYKPTTTFAICCYEDTWYFGTLLKNDFDWEKHNKKPFSYSNSININIAKALVNIAAQNKKETKLLDACCGVGTIMLEAFFAGNNIEGCDINWKVCRQARANLAHFNYKATVYRSDIKDIDNRYDAAIIDLPYNLFSCANDDTFLHILESAAQIADRLVVVSTTDIEHIIDKIDRKVIDVCTTTKRANANFARKIWVCEQISI
ncbi:TRM11 family SAM-dependent methyltransferase [Marinifilum sp.]|uniref:TRM11 family SAM-dependent methyltransferase n=1 Tax=Marinifilum sp. TaxID=2033137 RepID=UPI003BAAAEC7